MTATGESITFRTGGQEANGASDYETVAPPGTGVTPDDTAKATGSLTARLEAKKQLLESRTKRIPVPPDDVWAGELMLICKPVPIRTNMPFAALVEQATVGLEILNPDTGAFDPVEDGWVGIGRLMGIDTRRVSVGQVITAVCSSREVLAGLAEQILAFITGRQSTVEQALGE